MASIIYIPLIEIDIIIYYYYYYINFYQLGTERITQEEGSLLFICAIKLIHLLLVFAEILSPAT